MVNGGHQDLDVASKSWCVFIVSLTIETHFIPYFSFFTLFELEIWAWNLFELELCASCLFILADKKWSQIPLLGEKQSSRVCFIEHLSLSFTYFFYLIVRNCVFVQTVSIHFSRTKRESKSHSWARNIAHVNNLFFNHFCRGLGLGWGIHYLSWFWAGVWPCERAGHPVGIYTHP